MVQAQELSIRGRRHIHFSPLNVNWTFRGEVVRQWTLGAFLDKSKLMHFHIKILSHMWNGARGISQ